MLNLSWCAYGRLVAARAMGHNVALGLRFSLYKFMMCTFSSHGRGTVVSTALVLRCMSWNIWSLTTC